MAVGHTYYYLEDIFPNQPGGFKILKTPQILKVLCDESPDDPDYAPPPEERPGGYDWGAGGGANPGAENNHNDNDDQNIGDNNNVLHNDENQNLQEMPPQNNNGVLWSQENCNFLSERTVTTYYVNHKKRNSQYTTILKIVVSQTICNCCKWSVFDVSKEEGVGHVVTTFNDL